MTISWSRTPAQAWSELAKREADAIESETVALVDGLTDQAAAWMKQEARWTDRTGQARANLYADTLHVARRMVSMLLSHGPTIDYARFLEANPQFAVLGDAVDWWAPVLYRGLLEIAKRHGGG